MELTQMKLTAAQHHYYQTKSIDRKLKEEHRRLLWQDILMAIKEEQEFCDYEVPLVLLGSYPTFDVNEMVLYLLKKLRQGNLKCRIRASVPGRRTIRVWGWAEGQGSDDEATQDLEVKRGGTISVKTKQAAVSKKKAATITLTPAQVRKGALSKHLNQRLAIHRGRQHS